MKDNLPIPINQNNKISKKIKNTITKTGKIAGYSLVLLGITAIGVTMPILALPAVAGAAYTGQKLLNNTMYKSNKDLVLITKEGKNSTKIYQDPFRIDILKTVSKLTDAEKAGFLQMQTILGIGRLENLDKKGYQKQYETDTHGIVRKTLKDLNRLGYIQNYEEEYIKQSRLIFPKLAFGSVKSLREKKNLYNVRFKLGEKKLDIEDETLKRTFPLIFNKKNGILSKYGYSIEMKNGIWMVDYKNKSSVIEKTQESGVRKNKDIKATNRKIEEKQEKMESFRDEIKKGSPTQIQQKEHTKKILGELNQTEEAREMNNEKNVDNNFHSNTNSDRNASLQK